MAGLVGGCPEEPKYFANMAVAPNAPRQAGAYNMAQVRSDTKAQTDGYLMVTRCLRDGMAAGLANRNLTVFCARSTNLGLLFVLRSFTEGDPNRIYQTPGISRYLTLSA